MELLTITPQVPETLTTSQERMIKPIPEIKPMMVQEKIILPVTVIQPAQVIHLQKQRQSPRPPRIRTEIPRRMFTQ